MLNNYLSIKAYIFYLSIIIITGILLRMAWIYECDRGTRYLPDEYNYFVSTAENAFRGKGFYPGFNDNPEFSQGGVLVPQPMEAFFIYIVYKLAGKITDPIIPRLIQAFLGGIMIISGGIIGLLLGMPIAGIIIATLFAVYPEFVFQAEILQMESNYLVGLAVLLASLTYWIKTDRKLWALISAIMIGFLILQRSITLALPVFLFAFSLYALKKRKALRDAFLFLCVPMFVMAPWSIRNLIIYGEPVLVGSLDGIALYISNNIKLDPIKAPYAFFEVLSNPDYDWKVSHIEKKYRRNDTKKFVTNNEGTLLVSWYKYSEAYKKEAFKYIMQHPGHFFKNLILKTWNQFWLVQDLPRKAVHFFDNKKVFYALHRILLFGGIAGLLIVLLTHRKKEFGPIILLFFYYSTILSLGTLDPSGRYNVYLKVFLIIFLACGCNIVILRFIDLRRAAKR